MYTVVKSAVDSVAHAVLQLAPLAPHSHPDVRVVAPALGICTMTMNVTSHAALTGPPPTAHRSKTAGPFRLHSSPPPALPVVSYHHPRRPPPDRAEKRADCLLSHYRQHFPRRPAAIAASPTARSSRSV